jgi:hypothetical protein
VDAVVFSGEVKVPIGVEVAVADQGAPANPIPDATLRPLQRAAFS